MTTFTVMVIEEVEVTEISAALLSSLSSMTEDDLSATSYPDEAMSTDGISDTGNTILHNLVTSAPRNCGISTAIAVLTLVGSRASLFREITVLVHF